MYNIYYSLKDQGWEGVDFETTADTVIKAFMCAVREIRTVLMSTKVEFLPISETEFVIWLQGTCKGYLQVTEREPVEGG